MTSYETIDWKQVGAETEIWDVRSPSEFAEDHIPGARNVPVLSDEERARLEVFIVGIHSRRVNWEPPTSRKM